MMFAGRLMGFGDTLAFLCDFDHKTREFFGDLGDDTTGSRRWQNIMRSK